MRRLTGRSSWCLGAAVSLLGALAGCSDGDSTTDLNTEGPPMVRQVFVSERVQVGTSVRIRTGLAFGDHPSISADSDDRTVTQAVARGNQTIRVVLDELVRGNAIEELACADGSFSRVPDGTSPDDVANCSDPDDPDCRDICIGAEGPIGILDVNLDGAADDTRLIEFEPNTYAVNLECGGQNMPLDRQLSFYNPSGNQQVPAGPIGINGLGPSLVLVPAQGMRTGSECTIKFRAEVVDKDGNAVCAPTGGDVTQNCPADGDTSLITFNVEALALAGSDPKNDATNVNPATPGTILLQFNAAIDAATLGAITLSDGAADVPVTTAVSTDDPTLVTVEAPTGFAADTTYTLTIATTLADVFGGALPAEGTLTFTTGAGGGGTPDAGTPDAPAL